MIQENWTTDSEFLVDDAVLLGQPVDAVIALPHPTKQEMIIIIHENSGQKYKGVGPADSATDGVGGETSGHAASRLVHGSQVDLGEGFIITTNLGVKKQVDFKSRPGDRLIGSG